MTPRAAARPSKRSHVTAQITRGLTARDVEAVLSAAVADANPSPAIQLARNLGDNFFIDTWVSILIGSIARRRPDLTIIDWSEHQGDLEKYEHYIYDSV